MVQYPPFEQPYQLANPLQTRMMRYTQQHNGPSPKTVSDIENFMENWKMRDIPSFHPKSSGYFQGLAPIYCSNKDEWIFLHKAIVHRSSLEESIKNLDVERNSQKTKMFVEGVVGLISPALEKLNEKSNAQTDSLAKQGKAQMKLLGSKTSDAFPADVSSVPTASDLPSVPLSFLLFLNKTPHHRKQLPLQIRTNAPNI